jgi:hypothetical protein
MIDLDQIHKKAAPVLDGHFLAAAEHGGKCLETWLWEKLFTQHCKQFQHRPFLWRIWEPNINWNNDRGKDVESAPWYHLFNGDCINDHQIRAAPDVL